jgi:uncharacterized membrane protein
MSETDFADFGNKTSGDRTVMHVLYGLHTLAPFSFLSLSVIALIVNYIKRPDEDDPLYVTHHNYMISTFWWAILWFVVTGPLWIFFVIPGAIAWTVVGLWYIYRYIRGWLRFNNHQTPR